MARDSVIDRFKRNAQKQGSSPALFAQEEGSWSSISWTSYWELCRKFAGALIHVGHEPAQPVCIMGNNRPEWVIADVGAMMAQGVPAGVYQTSTIDQIAYIVNHCTARVLVMEKVEYWDRIKDGLDQFEHLTHVVLMEGADTVDHEMVQSFDDFIALGVEHADAVDERIANIKMEDLATLIYTSGTTGPPKGVMLSHTNLAFTSKVGIECINGITSADRCLSYLPLSHIAEQMFTIHVPLSGGAKVYFCDDMSKLKESLVVARPTYFLGVPRVWEKFKTALDTAFGDATGAKAKIMNWARGVGMEDGLVYLNTGRKTMKYKIADKLFFSKLKGRLGLDAMRTAIVGAAPVGKDVLEFFLSCGLPIHEVYGQSEGSGPTTFNRPKPGWTKFGAAGRQVPGAEVKIADDGEILLRGDNVFMGYYGNEEATGKTLIDGWLHSGDIGEFDDDGYLFITDRKKDIIITAGGKNVAPQNSEKLLRRIDGISQAVVIGERRKFLSVLLTLDLDRVPALAKEHGWPTDPKELVEHEAFTAHVQKGVDEANAELARYENLRKFTVLPLDFTVEGGELTATQKIKRRVVNENFSDEIEAFYEGLS